MKKAVFLMTALASLFIFKISYDIKCVAHPFTMCNFSGYETTYGGIFEKYKCSCGDTVIVKSN